MAAAEVRSVQDVGVVFDLDGILVNTEPLWETADRLVVDTYGHPWEAALTRSRVGIGLEEATELLAEYLEVSDLERLKAERTQAYLDLLGRGVEPMLGARELLIALASVHIPVGVATNAPRILAETALAVSGLDHLIEEKLVATSDEVEAPKPAPDVYLLACNRLSLHPQRVVAIDDSSAGITAAVEAGLLAVACPTLPDSNIFHAHRIVNSLCEIDVPELISWIEKRV